MSGTLIAMELLAGFLAYSNRAQVNAERVSQIILNAQREGREVTNDELAHAQLERQQMERDLVTRLRGGSPSDPPPDPPQRE